MRNFFHISLIILISGLMLFCLVGEGRAACGELLPGESIIQNQSIVSCDGRFRLTMQDDGNLVLYQEGIAEALWASGISAVVGVVDARDEFYLSMQAEDGNLVVYFNNYIPSLDKVVADVPIWASGLEKCLTGACPGAYLAVQDDGNTVVYDAGGSAIWATNTAVEPPSPECLPGCGVLCPGQGISQGQSIVSCDGRFTLTLQTGGNLELYQEGKAKPLWESETGGHGTADSEFTLTMREDGNLVTYWPAPKLVIWSSKTNKHPGAWLAVQDDGNAVVYDADNTTKLWETHTVYSPICSSLTYPSDRWQRVWYDLNSICVGDGPDVYNEQFDFDTDWGGGIVAHDRTDEITLLSSRTIFLTAGTYTFTVGSDDGARLWIDKVKIDQLDQWLNRGYTTDSVTLTFKSDGNHKFRLDYFENTGGARLSFNMVLVPPAEPEDVFCGSNQIGWGGYSEHLEFFQSVFCNNLDNLGYSDASVNESGRHLVDSADWGGDLFCGPNEVVCGGRDFDSSADAPLDMVWCCPINGINIDQTSGRLVKIGKDVALGVTTCSKDEVLCGAQNCDDSNTALDKLWCCPTESIPAGGPSDGTPPGGTPSGEECACVDTLIHLSDVGGTDYWTPQCSSGCGEFAGDDCVTSKNCIPIELGGTTFEETVKELLEAETPDGTPQGGSRVLLSNPLKWGSFEDLVDAVIKFLIMISAPIAAIMFVIAGFYFVTSAGDPVKAQTARRIMIYTAVGLAVILLASGLIKVLQSLLGGS